MNINATLDPLAVEVCEAIHAAGGTAYVIGGTTRDLFRLGHLDASHDVDLEAHNILPGKLKDVLVDVGAYREIPLMAVGEAFMVYKLGHVDVSIPRADSKGRHPTVSGDPFMGIQEATRRRDFTVNGISWDPLADVVHDPFDGLTDLHEGRLKVIDPVRFGDDPLRVLRAMRFVSQLYFFPTPETAEICRFVDLTTLPAERIQQEFLKMLLGARPGDGLRVALELGIIAQLFPEIEALVGVPQHPTFHPEGWSLVKESAETIDAYTTEPISGDWSTASLRDFITSLATVYTRGVGSPRTSPAQAIDIPAVDGLSATLETGELGRNPTAVPRPAVLAKPQPLIWSIGTSATLAREVVRVVFPVPLSRVLGVVNAGGNDLEVLRDIVGPIAIYVMDMLKMSEGTAENLLHDDTMETDTTGLAWPGGIYVPIVTMNARSAAIDGHVNMTIDIAIRDVHPFDYNKLRIYRAKQGDVFEHTCQVLDVARTLIDAEGLDYQHQVTVMLGALCHDLGKPSTTEFLDGRWKSLGHEGAGIMPTRSLLTTLNINTINGYDVRAQVLAIVQDHLAPGHLYTQWLAQDVKGLEFNPSRAIRRLSRKVNLDLLYRVAKADSLGRFKDGARTPDSVAQEWFIEQARVLNVEHRPPVMLVNGRDLLTPEFGFDLKPGPVIGEICRHVYELQLDGVVTTFEEALNVAREYTQARFAGS